jgi:hypothetical protein
VPTSVVVTRRLERGVFRLLFRFSLGLVGFKVKGDVEVCLGLTRLELYFKLGVEGVVEGVVIVGEVEVVVVVGVVGVGVGVVVEAVGGNCLELEERKRLGEGCCELTVVRFGLGGNGRCGERGGEGGEVGLGEGEVAGEVGLDEGVVGRDEGVVGGEVGRAAEEENCVAFKYAIAYADRDWTILEGVKEGGSGELGRGIDLGTDVDLVCVDEEGGWLEEDELLRRFECGDGDLERSVGTA